MLWLVRGVHDQFSQDDVAFPSDLLWFSRRSWGNFSWPGSESMCGWKLGVGELEYGGQPSQYDHWDVDQEPTHNQWVSRWLATANASSLGLRNVDEDLLEQHPLTFIFQPSGRFL
jgi:hypothetical protein